MPHLTRRNNPTALNLAPTLALILALPLSAAPLTALAQRAPDASLPVWPPGATTDTYFGTVVPDPYRALEDTKNKDVIAWMKAHSEHAHRSLQALPARAGLLASLQKYDGAVSARVMQVRRVPGGRLFYEKRGAKENQFKLYTRDPSGRERLLVDPAALSRAAKTSQPHAINWYMPSDDGKLVAYGASLAGSEAAFMRVIDVASGRQLGAAIPRVDWGGVAWHPGNKRLSFTQLQALPPGADPQLKYQDARISTLQVGARTADAKPALMRGTPGVDIAAAEIPFVSFSADGRHTFATVINGVQRELRVYRSAAADYLAGRAKWQLLIDRADGVVGWSYTQGTLYAITHQGAPRYKLVAGPVEGFSASKAATLLAPNERVLTGIAAASDALYLEQREGNVKRLSKLPLLKDGVVPNPAPTPTAVSLPVEGAFSLNDDESGQSAADPRLPGLLVELQGWTRAAQLFEVSADGSVRNTGLQPAGPYDTRDDLVTVEMSCKSHDGAMVPMSLIHKKGLTFDGSHPTLLYGYASYGMTEEPFFSHGRLAWIDAGGVMAVANPRGSGVLGQDWYKGGFQATKPNTWKDFIACAETLIAQKVTTPARLGILGGSAGGILVGRAMTERPDLFGAVVPVVGALDTVRAELSPNGVPNIPEFGTHKTEAGFKGLLAMSTYHQIKDGVKYPAVLLTHGVNDPRVEVWESTKAAARLMAATSSGKPVLLRLDFDAGHGIGNTKAQQLAERADIYAFLMSHLGGAK